ncbi:protein phosphatase 1M [Callorhinchus milii]|uniref:protein phosphatase 1M n=1 Tax=Callorhinchus milii TaxID=7868 RepID=UPI0004572F91|nr:protein phosphatase 1M [Callorhinchus milii]|eukprot:gi/632946267/ref/XP_007888473.1/ PREDICTED: protein phosphatase 1M isoform X1 [Callorhinchus milii]
MFKRFRKKSSPALEEHTSPQPASSVQTRDQKIYCRPHFLHKTWGEMPDITDHQLRPILVPPKNKRLPWGTGYSEVINAGKSVFNEDQAVCTSIIVKKKAENEEEWVLLCLHEDTQDQEIKCYYWALFDGHGGSIAAIQASKHLHHCIREQLEEIYEIIGGPLNVPPPLHLDGKKGKQNERYCVMTKNICIDHLVTGALETAFKCCDELICKYQESTSQSGGCTALTILFLHGKLYVASAGDSRAIIVFKDREISLSNEFTAETERQKIQYLAFLKPELLGGEFSRYEFPCRVKRSDIGKKILYRDYFMSGWGYKIAEEDDLKYPVIHGEGKQTRVMGTIAVTRGLGDHQLQVHETNLHIKPFLSCIPEVIVFDLTQHKFEPNDVLIMGTDGLWDILSNKEVADIVDSFLAENKHPHRYTMLAQYLVHKAKGTLCGNEWKTEDGSFASFDDISVFVIPLYNMAATTPPLI